MNRGLCCDTDKASVEVPAPSGGVALQDPQKAAKWLRSGEVLALLEDGAVQVLHFQWRREWRSFGRSILGVERREGQGRSRRGRKQRGEGSEKIAAQGESPRSTSGGGQVTTTSNSNAVDAGAAEESGGSTGGFVMPAAQRILEQNGMDAAQVPGSGPGNRVLKQDAQAAVDNRAAAPTPQPSAQPAPQVLATPPSAPQVLQSAEAGEDEEIVPMTMLRRRIAEHLVSAQQNAALLTTFNEIDMSAVMAMRKEIQEQFTKKHEVKLGFMSFFVKACIDALKMYPGVNAEIRGTDIVYRNHYDIGVAIGGGRGLVVPVLKRAERMASRTWRRTSRVRQARQGQQAEPQRVDGRHVHHHQRRRLRLSALDANRQRAAVGHPGNARHSERPVARMARSSSRR
jgi:2-oxoglutarate dehydrogenase E2 component (dihydrolipoamide succinyltransferase)